MLLVFSLVVQSSVGMNLWMRYIEYAISRVCPHEAASSSGGWLSLNPPFSWWCTIYKTVKKKKMLQTTEVYRPQNRDSSTRKQQSALV